MAFSQAKDSHGFEGEAAGLDDVGDENGRLGVVEGKLVGSGFDGTSEFGEKTAVGDGVICVGCH